MNELINQLTSKVGLTGEQASSALAVVMGFMKDKLPADLMNQLTTAMPDIGNMLGDAAGSAKNAAGNVAGAASNVAGTATGKASDAAGSAKDAGSSVVDQVKSIFNRD